MNYPSLSQWASYFIRRRPKGSYATSTGVNSGNPCPMNINVAEPYIRVLAIHPHPASEDGDFSPTKLIYLKHEMPLTLGDSRMHDPRPTDLLDDAFLNQVPELDRVLDEFCEHDQVAIFLHQDR